jgi:bacterioferritin-associated ferredoxin
MVRHQRAFIEAAIDEVREAKELLLPTLMVTAPDEPWTASSIASLSTTLDDLDPHVRRAAEWLLTFELPFVAHEEALAAEGVSLAADMARFEVAMVAFERAFWDARYAEYLADPERWPVRDRPVYDVCEQHRLDADRVRRAIRDHGATSFEDIAPLLGTSPTCATCHVGVTRLLIGEVRRQKAKATAPTPRAPRGG